ncbi:EAL domain-containing protein [Parasphingopyxis algicola]|uniref:putative bifunctional diguanylate cyclase/phosphodiesterase n=1 Tax=Parasphingopyxis algicola TaxID=2026624 RepID=UPI0015A37428|nr:EAL domain-containing protein [Parasphingopyxis algicola]QLC23949.1 EAL domain-containing protein [Parasphingopyxis algicola]
MPGSQSILKLCVSDKDLPRSIHIRLLDELYSLHPAVFLSSTLGAGVVGGAATWRTGDPVLAAFTVITCLATLAMLQLQRAYVRTGPETRAARLEWWERRFAIRSACVGLGVGLLTAYAFLCCDDAIAHLLLEALALGALCTTVRNYFRPRIVLFQIAALLLLPAAAMVASGEPFYLFIAAGNVALAFNMARIVAGLYRGVVDSFKKDELLKEQNARFNAALGNMAHGLCMFGGDDRLLVCNDRYLSMYGLSSDIVKPGIVLRDLIAHSLEVGNHPSDSVDTFYHELHSRLGNADGGTFHQQLGNGRTLAVSHERLADGGWVTIHEDITERKKAEARIAHMARHDGLTGLANSGEFHTLLATELSAEVDGSVAVLAIDLDRFKPVNDTLGHTVGDALLKEVANRLEECVDERGFVARTGGDEFSIVQIAQNHPQAATTLAQRLIDSLSEPFEIVGHQVMVGASIGVAVAPDDGETPDDLMKNADLALYRAKADGRNCHRFFSPDMDERMQARRQLELDLRKALGAGEFALVYQPLVDTNSEEILGFEALLRWSHPTRGTVGPDEFIPLAEEIGIIGALGDWVLRQACHDATAWPDDISIAVNLSPLQFETGNLVNSVVSAMATSGLSAERLELEITEGVLIRDAAAARKILHQLQALGVRIAMDDFGTGYSSLSYLRSFPFDKIKIDQSFVHDINSDKEALSIVRAVVALGKSLGMRTTAEGIETEAQLERLRKEGCAQVQGFLTGRPMDTEAVADMFEDREPRQAVG